MRLRRRSPFAAAGLLAALALAALLVASVLIERPEGSTAARAAPRVPDGRARDRYPPVVPAVRSCA